MPRTLLPPKDRIKKHVEIASNGCWLWNSFCGKDGYGQVSIGGGKSARAHRISYVDFIGPIPPGLYVCHSCDTPQCVNPAHLFLGTAKDNAADCIAKGRAKKAPQGEEHPMAKLTNMDVWIMRKLYLIGFRPTHISKRFGVSPSCANTVCRGVSHKRVDMEAQRSEWARTNRFAIALAAKKSINTGSA